MGGYEEWGWGLGESYGVNSGKYRRHFFPRNSRKEEQCGGDWGVC